VEMNCQGAEFASFYEDSHSLWFWNGDMTQFGWHRSFDDAQSPAQTGLQPLPEVDVCVHGTTEVRGLVPRTSIHALRQMLPKSQLVCLLEVSPVDQVHVILLIPSCVVSSGEPVEVSHCA
jgi:hypothetical protein